MKLKFCRKALIANPSEDIIDCLREAIQYAIEIKEDVTLVINGVNIPVVGKVAYQQVDNLHRFYNSNLKKS